MKKTFLYFVIAALTTSCLFLWGENVLLKSDLSIANDRVQEYLAGSIDNALKNLKLEQKLHEAEDHK